MSVVQYVFGTLLILMSLALIIVVLLQESRSAGLSGAIAGGADTFFGKSKGKTAEQKMVKITKVLAVAFFIVTLGLSIFFMFKY